MTHILVLGAGEVGTAVVRYAAELESVSRVTVADLKIARAQQTAEGNEKVDACAIDVDDHDALLELMQGKRAVLNTVGPFYRFAETVFRAALKAGIDYLDVADDWEPVLALLEFGAQAKAAGVCSIVGMGASPGAANVLARAAMEDRPEATDLITAWRADDVRDGYSAAKEHWLHQCTGTIRVLRDGRMVDEAPLQPIEATLPLVGPVTLASVGHPEAVTLPRRYGDLQLCANAMVIPPKLLAMLRTILAEDPKDMRRAASEFNDRYFALGDDDLSVVGTVPGMFAMARTPDGAASLATLHQYPDGLGPITAAPLVAALALVLDGKGPGPGVWSPEDAFAPAVFFAAFARIIGSDEPVWRLEQVS